MDDVEVRGIASATGRHASATAASAGAVTVTTDINELLQDDATDGVLVCSSQPEHYEHIRLCVEAGKAVFVEKPMVTRLDQFGELLRLMEGRDALVTLGLNRRYSPMIEILKESMIGPVDFVEYVITQPFVPADHWTLDPVDGGGRLITEGEHFIDLCNLLVAATPVSVTARALGEKPADLRTLCNFAITLQYEGAAATVVFNESGAAGFPRERLTVLSHGRVAILDDFAKLTVHGLDVKNQGSGLRKSMGHAEELEQFVRALRGQPNHLLSWEDASTATLCMFAAQESIRTGVQIDVAEFRAALLAAPEGEDEPDDGEVQREAVDAGFSNA
jgi:polar amino acid transport system substrate-binding protein